MAVFIIGVLSVVSLALLTLKRKTSYVLQKSKKISGMNVSIVIPARNEEINLHKLLKSVELQSLKPYEVIVVNDESVDNTVEIAQSFGAKIVHVNGRPDNFKPKAFAAHQGYLHSSGEIILFLDADTYLHEHFLSSLLKAFGTENVDAITVQPKHEMLKVFEQLSLIFHFVSITASGVFSLIKINNGFYGPCIAMKRNAYESTRGFENSQVLQSVIEDYELSKIFKENNLSYSKKIGGELIKYRMYNSLKMLFYGWIKNISRGATKTNPLILLSIVLVIGSFISMPITLLASGGSYQLPIFACWIILLILLFRISLQLGNYLLGALLYPVCITFFLFTFIYALFKQLSSKKVFWSGREIEVAK